MSVIVTNVTVLDNPSSFLAPLKFEITFDCVAPGIHHELEWKLIYVGSADDEKHDQELDSVLVGPVEVGKNKFVFSAPPPNPDHIPESDLLDVTVILLTCSYQEKEFIRVGYYVNNEYQLPEGVVPRMDAQGNPILPSPLDHRRIRRNILADKPRVTRFQVPWDGQESEVPRAQYVEHVAGQVSHGHGGSSQSAYPLAGAGGGTALPENEVVEYDDDAMMDAE